MEENNNNVQNVEQPVTPVEPVQQEVQPVVQNNEPVTLNVKPPKKSKKGLIITIIVLVLLAVGGLTTWLIISNNNSDSDEPDTEEKENKKDKEEDNDKDKKSIYFYKGMGNYGNTYSVKYDYSAPSKESDLLVKYVCDTDECSIDYDSIEYIGTSYDDVEFFGAVIHEKDYYNYFDGKNKTKLNVPDESKLYVSDKFANSIISYSNDSNLYAIYSLKTNKTISEFKYSKSLGTIILFGDDAYVYIYVNQDYDVYNATTGEQILDEKEKLLIRYIFELLKMNIGVPFDAPYFLNINYIKTFGLTKEVYLDSSVMYGSMGGANQNWLSQQQPSADECSLTDESGKEYKCNELKMYDFDKVDESVYKYFGKHLDKEDCVDSNNKKYCVYVPSINAIGFIGGGNIKSSSPYDTRSAIVSYKINGDKVDAKFTYMDVDNIKNKSCTSTVAGNTECMKYILDNYDNGKASTYTLHLVWDTDHYYIDDITFDK